MTADEAGKIVAGTVVEANGREVPVSVADVDISKAISGVTYGPGTDNEIHMEPTEDGLVRLDFSIFDDMENGEIPLGIPSGNVAYMTSGPLWMTKQTDDYPLGLLLIDDPERLQAIEDDEDMPYSLSQVEGLEGYWAIFDDDKPVTVEAVIFGIAYVRGVLAAYDEMQSTAEEEQPEELTIAQYKTDKSFVNHSFSMKVFNGLYEIAFGAPSFEISPKNGKSAEKYKLTASQDSCRKFFYECGGNVEQIKDVLETVYTLRTDKRAEGFVCNGRVWFTVNTIVEEMRRTTAGTIAAKKYPNDRKIIDAALVAASGAQIVGTKANGEPTNVMYAVNAVRRDTIEYNGNTYNDVWGFVLDASTINDYAREIKQAYSYPLLAAKKPLTIDEAWIDRYLRDVLNKARGKLYKVGKSGNPSAQSSKVKKYTIEIRWEIIFETASPMKEPDGRQKQRIVKTFEKVLKLQADMEKNGKMREGMPMYITAYSERDASRGRGKGAWVKLVIECSREMHVPSIDLS